MKLFDKHHGTQFFFTVMGVIIMIAAVIIGWNQHNINEVKRQIKDTTYLYGNSYRWSVTGDSCTIVGCYRNEAQDRVAIVFKNDVLAKEPLDAASYRAVIAGANGEQMYNIPKGILYGYGDGYFTLVFDSTTPFVNQAYEILIQNKMDTTSFDSNNGLNQIIVRVNLGMNTMPILPCLDSMGKEFKPDLIYADIVLGENVTAVKESLDAKAANLYTYKIELVAQYDKLKGLGVNVPDIPYGIYNDIIDHTNRNCNKIYTTDMDANSPVMNNQYNLYGDLSAPVDSTVSDGSSENAESQSTNNAQVDPSKYYVYFENVFPGYSMIDYHNLHASDEMLSLVTDMTYSEYMEFNEMYRSDVDNMMNITKDDSYTKMRMMNGEYVEDEEVIKVIDAYRAALDNYLINKRDYLNLINNLYTIEETRQYIVKDITYTENVGQLQQ